MHTTNPNRSSAGERSIQPTQDEINRLVAHIAFKAMACEDLGLPFDESGNYELEPPIGVLGLRVHRCDGMSSIVSITRETDKSDEYEPGTILVEGFVASSDKPPRSHISRDAVLVGPNIPSMAPKELDAQLDFERFSGLSGVSGDECVEIDAQIVLATPLDRRDYL